MDTLQTQRVEEPARITRNQRAGGVRLWNGVPSSFGQRLGAVPHHLAAVEEPCHERMPLELIERHVRVEERVLVVEPHDESYRQPPLRHRVEEPAAELIVPERITHGMHDGSALDPIVRHFPQFLDSDRELLRFPTAPQLIPPQQLLGQIAAHAIAEDRHLRADIDARFERRLPLPALVDSTVSGPHAHHGVVLR